MVWVAGGAAAWWCAWLVAVAGFWWPRPVTVASLQAGRWAVGSRRHGCS